MYIDLALLLLLLLFALFILVIETKSGNCRIDHICLLWMQVRTLCEKAKEILMEESNVQVWTSISLFHNNILVVH